MTEHGERIENTFDWYAQDECGNVWYLGENTKEYENGEVVSTAGSWKRPRRREAGIIMPATHRSVCGTGRSTTRAKPRTRPRF